MDKRFLVVQLTERLSRSARVADQASEAAAEEAREGATPAERREDSRTALEFSRLARAQARRAAQARSDLDTLAGWEPSALPAGGAVDLGALVEVEDEKGQGLTFFLAPVGAGEELAGPGGDGFLSVVTPSSPLGRAVMGRRVGDTVEVRLEGGLREWTIVWAG